jgi:hypothetical protein
VTDLIFHIPILPPDINLFTPRLNPLIGILGGGTQPASSPNVSTAFAFQTVSSTTEVSPLLRLPFPAPLSALDCRA